MPQISAHIEEIIEKKPNWLIRLGISGMLLLLLTLLFVAWWVKYPDVIKAAVYISTPKAPIDLVCPSNAQIEKIFTKDAERKIAKGNPLILLKSTSDYGEIQKLQLYLGALEKDSLTENHSIIRSNFIKLGVLQKVYNQLTSYVNEYNEHIKSHTYQQRIVFLQRIIGNNTQSLQSTRAGFLLELKDQNIMEKDKIRSDSLFAKGVISQRDHEIAQQRFLQKEIKVESIRTILIDKSTAIVNLQKQLTELKIQQDRFNREIRDNIRSFTKTLHAQIEEWKGNYLILAPINGTVSIFKELNKGDYLSAGSYLLTMLPLGNQELFAYGNFSVAKAGKLKENNKVIIKLHSFPYREYGSIDGFIEKISDFPIKEMYSVKIRLPNKLETGYDKKIIFKQRLSGDAELITENRSLLSRIFSNFKYFIEKNVKEE